MKIPTYYPGSGKRCDGRVVIPQVLINQQYSLKFTRATLLTTVLPEIRDNFHNSSSNIKLPINSKIYTILNPVFLCHFSTIQ